jgi:dolichol-phosphate mannosyltransferase
VDSDILKKKSNEDGTTAGAKQKVSVIVPTFREGANIRPLVESISKAMGSHPYEVIVVDDNSNDGIEEAVQELSSAYPVRIHVRRTERGLSSAVIAGFGLCTGEVLVVMDADLSHPPEKLPELVAPIIKGDADFVIGSRFVPGGGTPHFNSFRKLNAWISKMLARPFTRVNDPMAGFFAFPRSLLKDGIQLSPVGFKIGLELIVKAGPTRIREIPILFQERLHGDSKLSLKEQLNYIKHLKRLFDYKYPSLIQFVIFSLVGSSGMVVDLFSVFVSYSLLLIPYRVARCIGFLLALTSNFFLNRHLTFAEASKGSLPRQYLSFVIVCLMGFAVNWSISVYLFEHLDFFHEHYLISAFMGIMGGLTVNFLGSKKIVFK